MMSEPVIAAIIAAIASITAAAITAYNARDTRAVKVALTRNGGANDPPTMPDRLHDIDVKLALVLQRQDQVAQEQRDQWSAINDLRRHP